MLRRWLRVQLINGRPARFRFTPELPNTAKEGLKVETSSSRVLDALLGNGMERGRTHEGKQLETSGSLAVERVSGSRLLTDRRPTHLVFCARPPPSPPDSDRLDARVWG